MNRYWIAAVLGVLAIACGRNCSDTGLYEKNGQMKPIVVVLPVIDRTADLALDWDLSTEMTDEIRKRVFDSSKLYLLREGGSVEIAKTLACADPHALSPVALRDFGASEFVVVAEVLEQKQNPYGMPSHKAYIDEMGAVLSLKMRVRVIDRRNPEPRIVLQEVFEHDHIVARPYLNTDYTKTPWGTEPFHNTPMGLVHSRAVRELVSHVEGYVIAAK